MRKKITLLLFSIILQNSYSQIGINTSNPQQVFHIDGKSSEETTNPTVGVPNAIQQSDDFVITSKGQLGIGTTFPIAKIDINNNGNTNGTIRIVDGRQQENKVLTSDDNGVATWQDISFITINGNVPNTFSSFGVDDNKSLGANITLPRGRWFIFIGMLVEANLEPYSRLAGRFRLFSSDTEQSITGYEFISFNKNNPYTTNSVTLSQISSGFGDYKSGLFVTGIVRVEVIDPSITLYLWDFDTRKYGVVIDRNGSPIGIEPNEENYLFAIKEQ